MLDSGVNKTQEDEMPQEDLKQLYIDELKDLYNAETQLVKALPKMAKAATNTQLPPLAGK